MKLSEAISNCRSIYDVQPIVFAPDGTAKTQVKLSFWGSRYIKVLGNDGVSNIDALASKIIELVREKNFDFNEQERAIGKVIATQISMLYETSDKLFTDSNCFTRLLCSIREFITRFCESFYHAKQSNDTLTRWEWNGNDMGDYYSEAFSYYPLGKFQERFGRAPLPQHMRNSLMGNTPFNKDVLCLGPYNPPPLAHENW